MNITPTTRTVTDYHLTLSAEDAQACIEKPWDFGEALAEQLRAAGLGPAPATNGAAKQHNRVHLTLGTHKGSGATKRAAKKSARKVAKPKTPKASRKLTNECPYCNQLYSRAGNLARHIETAHPEKAQSSPASTNGSQVPPAPQPTWERAPAVES